VFDLRTLHFSAKKLAESVSFHHPTKAFLQVSAIHQTKSFQKGGKTIVLPPFHVSFSMVK